MPLYDFQCTHCEEVFEIRCAVLDRSAIRSCSSCSLGSLRQVILSAPMTVIPGNMTHDGVHKVVGTPNAHQKPIVPIQFTEQMPDGRTKITTIGDK